MYLFDVINHRSHNILFKHLLTDTWGIGECKIPIKNGSLMNMSASVVTLS